MADPVEKLEAEVRKLAAAMKKLAADQAEHRRETGTMRQVVDGLEQRIDGLEQRMDSQFDVVHQELLGLQRTSQAMANAMTEAIKQLGIGKSVEARVARLEAAVFGDKH